MSQVGAVLRHPVQVVLRPVYHRYPSETLLLSVSFNSDGSRLAVTSTDRRVRVLDPRTGKILQVCLCRGLFGFICHYQFFSFRLKNSYYRCLEVTHTRRIRSYTLEAWRCFCPREVQPGTTDRLFSGTLWDSIQHHTEQLTGTCPDILTDFLSFCAGWLGRAPVWRRSGWLRRSSVSFLWCWHSHALLGRKGLRC